MNVMIMFITILAVIGLSRYAVYQLRQANVQFIINKRIHHVLHAHETIHSIDRFKPAVLPNRHRLRSSRTQPILILTTIAASLFGVQWWLAFSSIAKLTTGIFYILGCLIILAIQANVRAKREKQFIHEFPDALDLMARAASAGHAIAETMGIVAENFSGLLGTEFKQVSHHLQMGYTLQEALQEAAYRIHLSEFSFFTIIIHLQQQTGGNIVYLLNQLSTTLRKKHRTNQKIKSLSAEAVASGVIIGILPLIIITAIAIFSPNYIRPLITTNTGHMIIVGCLVAQILGMMLMKKLIRIEL